MYKITYRGTEYAVRNLEELATIAWNTEKIDLLANVDEGQIVMEDAVNELQKLLDACNN